MRLQTMHATHVALGGVTTTPMPPRLAFSKAVRFFDGSNDPEVCCTQCGMPLGKDSPRWWDDYTCIRCHERH